MEKFDILRPAKAPKPSAVFQDALLILGAVLALTLVLIVWAKYGRKWKRRRSEYRKPTRSTATAAASLALEAPDEVGALSDRHHRSRRRKKYRRRREEHRQRNPTLAETGGLPPMREGQTTPPAAS
jgi:hypothetical protein